MDFIGRNFCLFLGKRWKNEEHQSVPSHNYCKIPCGLGIVTEGYCHWSELRTYVDILMLEKTTTESWNENYGKCFIRTVFFNRKINKRVSFLLPHAYMKIERAVSISSCKFFANKKFALHFAVFRRPTNTNLTIHLFQEKIWILIWISLFSIHIANQDLAQIFLEVRLRQFWNLFLSTYTVYALT